jgi:hypothetical protein
MKKATAAATSKLDEAAARSAWEHESWQQDPDIASWLLGADPPLLSSTPSEPDPNITRSPSDPKPVTGAQLLAVQDSERSRAPTEEERIRLLERAYDVLNTIIAKHGKTIWRRGLNRGAYAALVDATTDKWLAEGLLLDYAQKRAVTNYLLSLPLRDPNATADPAKRLDHALYALEPQETSLAYARTMGAALVPGLSAETRAAMRLIVAEWAASGKPLHQLESALGSSFGILSRDWLLIAHTEASLIRVHGKLAALVPGRQVTWDSAPDCCERCMRWNGSTFTVVTPGHPNKDPYTMTWPGKIALHRRDEDFADDRGVPPAIPMHEGCRCIYSVHLPEVVPASSLSPRVREHIRDLRRRAKEP